MALAIRLGISPEDMKQMSFVSLYNVMISCTNQDGTERKASQEDIDRMFG